MMPTAFEFEDGELVDSYDLGEAECPVCRCPVTGHFRSGVPVDTEPCLGCKEKSGRGSWVSDMST